MDTLLPAAHRIGALLKASGEKIAVSESSAGGLISAALLAMPGASAYFMGGAVVYTRQSRRLLLDLPDAALDGVPPSSEAYAAMMAGAIQQRFAVTWGLAETGATGPTGNRYGNNAGHACLAIAGPRPATLTVETGHGDRAANMRAFALATLELFERTLRG